MLLQALGPLRLAAIALLLLGITLVRAPTVAAGEAARLYFDIREGSAVSALNAFSRQSAVRVLFPYDAVANERVRAYRGWSTSADVLERLLKDTGLVVSSQKDGVVALTPAPVPDEKLSTTARREPAVEPAEAKGSTRLEEILVTARKRPESVYRVPAAVSVVPRIRLTGVSPVRMAEYAAFVPGLTVTGGSAIGYGKVSLRGLYSGQDSATVATYIDEVPVNPSATGVGGGDFIIDLLPYDIERVEVVKGPQGTLFGASAMGGLLRYVTEKPRSDTSEVEIGGELTTIDSGSEGWGIRASGNLPLIEGKLGFRASYYDRLSPGYIDNAAGNQQDVNTARLRGGRAALQWVPDEELSVRIAATAQSTNNASLNILHYDPEIPEPLAGDLVSSRVLNEEPFTQQTILYSANVIWDAGPITWTSVTGYSRMDTHFIRDITPAYTPHFAVPTGGAVALGREVDLRKFTQELRLASETDGRLDWLVGLFHTRERMNGGSYLDAVDSRGSLLPELTKSRDDHMDQSMGGVSYREQAIFAGLTYAMTEALDVSAGVRWAHGSAGFEKYNSGLVTTPESPETAVTARGQSDERASTFSLSALYHLDGPGILYCRVANGYRPGGANTLQSGVPTEFSPDSVVSYEVGFKSRLADGRVVLDTAAFRIDWSDIQLQMRNGPLMYTGNGGAAVSKGVELTGVFKVADGLNIEFNGAYVDPVMKRLSPLAASLQTRPGDRLPLVPRWSGSLVLDYVLPLGASWRGNASIGARYIGTRPGGFSGDLVYPLAAHTLLDVGIDLGNDRWSAGLFARNLTDERVLIGATRLPTAVLGTVNTPRVVGINFDVSF